MHLVKKSTLKVIHVSIVGHRQVKDLSTRISSKFFW